MRVSAGLLAENRGIFAHHAHFVCKRDKCVKADRIRVEYACKVLLAQKRMADEGRGLDAY